MKRNSIVFSLAAVILTILILFAAMITYRIYVIGSSQLIAEQEFSYSTIVADRRFQLRRELERLSDVIELMATNSLAEISTDDLQGKDRLLADIADMPLTAWKALFITDSRGMITSSTDPEFLRKDIGTSPYYQFLMNNRTNRTRLSYIPTSAIDTGLGFINHVFATRFTCRESG
ncbi:MAG: hypothetical protein JW765_00080, partial [Deltaproteobacteria bacterium]|nr:hypothetical protein [Candidatus Zymogenaceae bacterium]